MDKKKKKHVETIKKHTFLGPMPTLFFQIWDPHVQKYYIYDT